MSLIAELKRRNVFRVGVAYAIVAWLLVEVASVVLPTFEAPDWVMKVFTFLVILGFPLVLIFAWAFDSPNTSRMVARKYLGIWKGRPNMASPTKIRLPSTRSLRGIKCDP
jgi:hypothetical protein